MLNKIHKKLVVQSTYLMFIKLINLFRTRQHIIQNLYHVAHGKNMFENR